MSYTREDIWNAVVRCVGAMSLEDLQGIVSEDLYEYYKQGADDEELRLFIEEGEQL